MNVIAPTARPGDANAMERGGFMGRSAEGFGGTSINTDPQAQPKSKVCMTLAQARRHVIGVSRAVRLRRDWVISITEKHGDLVGVYDAATKGEICFLECPPSVADALIKEHNVI